MKRPKRLRLNLSLTSVIVLLAAGVLLPVMLSTAVGIVAIILARDSGGIITGVLVLCFTTAAAGSALIAVVLTAQKARLARLQADFLANVTHELRTPLSAIRLYAQTLQSDLFSRDPEEAAKCVATILRETEWLDVTLNRVLTWRASARGVLPLEMVDSTVSQAIEDAVERFRAMLRPDEVALSVDVDTEYVVHHDPTALGAVVLNLLTNAYKYTHADKQIKLSVRDESESVALTVRDNGIGLAPSETKHIFRPFYRIRPRDRSATGGIGLGLAIARELVNRHNGTIDVTSREGKGTTFVIHLPRAGATP